MSAVTLAANGLAVPADVPGNPYDAIVGRNVFGLKAPPPPPDPNATQRVEPPKMELQALTTILGRKQVLLKVLAKPPMRPKDESIVLDEGQRQGDIEIHSIDEETGTVKLSFNGETSTLNMKDHAAKPIPGAAAPPMPVPGVPPPAIPGGLPQPHAPSAGVPVGGGSSVTTIGGGAGGLPSRPIRGATGGNYGGGQPTGGFSAGGVGQPAQNPQALPQLSREEQEIMVEVNRLRYQDAGDPKAKIFPRTSMPKE